jgi:signal transduction histidine kinase
MEKRAPGGWFSGPVDGVVFAVIMAAAAFLGRENPDFVYPQVLYCFLGLLAFNLINFSVLPRLLSEARRAALAVAYNILFLSLVLDNSGGPQSYFWVLFLLPVFHACLALRRRGVLAAAASVAALLCVFHAEAFAAQRWPELLELLIKLAIICASAVVVHSVAGRESEARGRLEAELLRTERDKAQAREQLQSRDRLAILGTLVAGVTHELKTPVAAILAWAQMRPGVDYDLAELPRVLARVAAGARRCDKIMRDMLAFSRQKAGGSRLCDVNALLRECIKLKEHDWVLEGLRVELDLAGDLPQALLPPGEFQQVVFNLLTNAHQAIRGAARRSGRIRLSSRCEDGWLSVAVEDNGPGVPADIAERIWDSFFTTKPEGEGTGLGLAICRQIVAGQGGRLVLESAAGGGAVFRVILPLPVPAAPMAAPEALPAREPALSGKN